MLSAHTCWSKFVSFTADYQQKCKRQMSENICRVRLTTVNNKKIETTTKKKTKVKLTV